MGPDRDNRMVRYGGGGGREADRAEGLAFDRSSSHVQGTSDKTLCHMGQPPEPSNKGGQRYSCKSSLTSATD